MSRGFTGHDREAPSPWSETARGWGSVPGHMPVLTVRVCPVGRISLPR